MSGFDHLQFWHWFILAAIFAGIEMLTPGFFFIWLGGAALIVGRILHALGLSAKSGYSFGRFAGTGLSGIVLGVLAAWNLWAFARTLMS